MEFYGQLAQTHGITKLNKVVRGGRNRAESAYNAVLAAPMVTMGIDVASQSKERQMVSTILLQIWTKEPSYLKSPNMGMTS